jgi:hypothetical protein
VRDVQGTYRDGKDKEASRMKKGARLAILVLMIRWIVVARIRRKRVSGRRKA